MKIITNMFIALVLAVSITVVGSAAFAAGPSPVVVMETSMGRIMLLMNQDKAPETVKNFMRYVDEGFYDGTIFHRVINSSQMSIVQGGGFDYPMQKKRTYSPIVNEAGNMLSNKAGTISMARTSDINSATSQFFLNVEDNLFLNHTGNSPQNYGYAVFGKIIRGMDVLKKIVSVPTGRNGRYSDVPLKPVFIKRMYRKTE